MNDTKHPDGGTKRRRALITGLSGFTGRHMAERLLDEGYDVWGTTSPASEADVPGTTGVPVDLLDLDAVRACVADAKPDVVVHLAGLAHVTGNPPTQSYLVNIMGSRNLLDALALLDKKPRAVLMASTSNVYGNANVEVIDENVPLNPGNDYAVSKLAMENMARLWLDRLPIFFTRPFNYTGVGQGEDFLLPKIVNHHARHEKKMSLGNLAVSRDFSDVRDVVDVYAQLIEKAPVGQAFNTCSGIGHSLGEILGMMRRIAGYEIEVFVDPRFMRRNEIAKLVGSNIKLRRAIGRVPVTPIYDTLEWMYQHARAKFENIETVKT
ncbi:GDP-mannose 4,6-dehydratase [Caballeronia sp. dw_276]|jgi:nucleoside-diphosphate-sugar epimerase|uniref:GDP-mannose 4,6-dehydratase n=1 Tax=Caballeronia sp. dw_276 TaxID=2719795 RepID=UPI001BD30467|nr:GDP-mannose 4,6-dehydratase [Caballeronia sp. dw_276]